MSLQFKLVYCRRLQLSIETLSNVIVLPLASSK
jgi:hypothetical protein